MSPHDAFIAPARARPALWRLALGVVLIVLLWALGTIGTLLAGWGSGAILPERRFDVALWLEDAAAGSRPDTLALVLLTFAALALATWLAARVLHGRGLRSLVGRGEGGAARFGIGFLAIALPAALGLLLPFGAGIEAQANLPPNVWLLWLAPGLLLVALQTGAEELAFRGYLQQQMAARFRSPLAWMVLPSLLFGLVHWDGQTFGPNAPLIVAAATLFGLVAADLTARTGSLHAAWGVHFGNNAFAILLTTTPGPLSGLALGLIDLDLADPGVMAPLVALDMGTLVVSWGLARWALARLRPMAGPPISTPPPEAPR
ncbi:hypothetical protein BCF33_2232 [Hasllibacter halocynthiae]|uniref:CAAX prenyl protease 2/Lysostaphin resistance protein A-like domain-containing protein n=1 Tax=Hasllibacter halocynthiae TaxID=595589 RepID=A0A2T0X3C5_9RHOB|nr:CPBP family intramembrane glutamic endopeptidase [Hasllibacter halocynthiae]PRY93364.1 hypothetical protein BCF33_2232 [Hasllibacter halocynthiae]